MRAAGSPRSPRQTCCDAALCVGAPQGEANCLGAYAPPFGLSFAVVRFRGREIVERRGGPRSLRAGSVHELTVRPRARPPHPCAGGRMLTGTCQKGMSRSSTSAVGSDRTTFASRRAPTANGSSPSTQSTRRIRPGRARRSVRATAVVRTARISRRCSTGFELSRGRERARRPSCSGKSRGGARRLA